MLKKMFSEDGEWSSKRIIGTICILFYILSLFASYLGLELSEIQKDLLSGLLYTGGVLLTAGVIDKFSAGFQSRAYPVKNDNPNNISES
jgi:hypothetical protein